MRVDLEVLQRLKARGDLQGVATAWAIDGSPGSLEQAAATLEGLLPAHALGGVVGPVGPSQAPDIDSDRAAVKVLQGRPEEALRLAERVLRARPDHTAAEWNRALALVALGLTEEGASSFERIAGWGIAGWSGEASERAAALRRGDEPVERGYKEVVAAGRAMVAGGPVIVELARRFPGYMRLFFYDAVRAAQSAERVRALLPLAVELDLQHGGHALESYAERIARGAFVRRGALARTYAQLAANPQAQEAGAQVAYLAEVRDAGEEGSIAGGALLYGARGGAHRRVSGAGAAERGPVVRAHWRAGAGQGGGVAWGAAPGGGAVVGGAQDVPAAGARSTGVCRSSMRWRGITSRSLRSLTRRRMRGQVGRWRARQAIGGMSYCS